MSMIYDGVEYHLVTTDDALHQQLRAKAEELDTIGLTEYVRRLGLTPPGHRQGDPIPAVVEMFTPDGQSFVIWTSDEDDEAEGLPPYDD